MCSKTENVRKDLIKAFGHSNIQNINRRSDYVIPRVKFGKNPSVIVEQTGWQKGLESIYHSYDFFTDGSKSTEAIGAAVVFPQFDL